MNQYNASDNDRKKILYSFADAQYDIQKGCFIEGSDSRLSFSDLYPKKLYKYRNCDKDGKNIEALRLGCVWFSAPITWKDPNDTTFDKDFDVKNFAKEHYHEIVIRLAYLRCCKKINESFENKNIYESECSLIYYYFFKKIKKLYYRNYKISIDKLLIIYEAVGYAKEYLRKYNVMRNIEKTISKIHKYETELRTNRFASCFSTTYNNDYQWNNYSDHHEGFCIEYAYRKDILDINILNYLLPIVYGKKPKILFSDYFNAAILDTHNNPFRENKLVKKLFVSLFTKETSYQHEDEWRLYNVCSKNESKGELVPFNYATAIYLGSEINNINREKLISIAKVKNIKVFQEKRIDDFAFSYSELEIL